MLTRQKTRGPCDVSSFATKKLKVEKDAEEEEELSLAEFANPIPWRKIESEGLDCDYALLFPKDQADVLFSNLEEEVVYATGAEAQVQVFGKLHNIPRKQATYGDPGLAYTYSGVTRSASTWTPTLELIRDAVTAATGHAFNFVLVNRYKDGLDHMGEHRDDEKELDPLCPIASVSLGASRDFIFRHRDARGRRRCRDTETVRTEPVRTETVKTEPVKTEKTEPVRTEPVKTEPVRTEPVKTEPVKTVKTVKMELDHGSLLLMNPPTNTFWYHSLPVRRKVKAPRINLTFRRILTGRK